MLQDKDIVNDYLSGINASLTGYATVITETNHPDLRQTIIELRNQDGDIIQSTKSELTSQG